MPTKTSQPPSSPISRPQWRAILQAHPEANFLQSPEWAQVNQTINHKVIVKNFKNHNLALMIVKDARRGRYLEIPGGPLLDWQDRATTEKIFTQIKHLAKAEHCAFIRFRPQLTNTPAHRALLPTSARPASFHLHAEHTVLIDLTKSEEALLKNMRRQTRYEVRRSAKLGLTVGHGNTKKLFETFWQVQSDTAKRQNFIPPRLEDLLAYREAFGAKAQIYYALSGETKTSPTPENLVAMGLIIISNGEADYFEAASTDLNRKLPGAYALQWQVMRDLKKQGITRYNLWGIAPKNQPHHRYAGVTTFKTGFGGEITEYIPAQDIIISPLRYLKTYLIETIRKKRRHLS